MKVSRSRLERFINCKRCAWLELRGLNRPRSFPYTLAQQTDVAMRRKVIDTKYIKRLEIGSRISTNYKTIELFGLLDDVWELKEDVAMWLDNKQLSYKGDTFIGHGNKGEIILVDYKSTGKGKGSPTPLVYDSYKRQMDIYWYILHRNGYNMNRNTFWYYMIGRANTETVLKFDREYHHYIPNISWIESCLDDYIELMSEEEPPKGECELCNYVSRTRELCVHTKTKRQRI